MDRLSELLKSGSTFIVDVRTHGEFMGGHVSGSLNIPLNEIPRRLSELKDMKPLVLCCASGGRSQQASMLLEQNGIESLDGGSWFNVNHLKNN